MVRDVGSGIRRNYTHPRYKMNPWYSRWLPDLTGDMDSLYKFTYYAEEMRSNLTGT
jgi:hypothetical protein